MIADPETYTIQFYITKFDAAYRAALRLSSQSSIYRYGKAADADACNADTVDGHRGSIFVDISICGRPIISDDNAFIMNFVAVGIEVRHAILAKDRNGDQKRNESSRD